MASQTISERVRKLIGENEQRAAADVLMQAFRDKNAQLFNIALMQQGNIKKLADQSALGILSQDQINREQAKINAALLHLCEEHTRLFESGARAAVSNRWKLWAGAALAALVLIGWLLNRSMAGTSYPETFDIEVRLHEPGGENRVIQEGKVALRLGEKVLQEQALDAGGKAVYPELSKKYRDSSVHLLYFPPRDRTFSILEQTATTITGLDQTIFFTLEFLPDTTVFEATLQDLKGRAISGATITIDGNLHATSDANGYFKVAIPKPGGATAHFFIEKNGKRLYQQDLMISSGHKAFPIE
jgi:hypothetical protein